MHPGLGKSLAQGVKVVGYYYLPGDGPPSRPKRWWQRLGQYVPGWLKSWWEDVLEVSAITRVVFSIILPIMAVLIAFVLICTGSLLLLTWLTGNR